MTARDAFSLFGSACSFLWWSWIASRWSGGGPRHPSYAAARFNAYVAGATISWFLRGRM